jgi:hypothetical protein
MAFFGDFAKHNFPVEIESEGKENIPPPTEICANTFNFEGYEYVQQSKPRFNSSSKTWVRYYRCKYYRPPYQCKATLSAKMTSADAENSAATLKSGSANHTCDVKLCSAIDGIKDVTDEMVADISNRAIVQCTASAIVLAVPFGLL